MYRDKMKADLGVSLIQYSPLLDKIDDNLSRLTQILEGIPESIDLVVLPEMFNTGFTMSVETQGEPMNGRTISWMREYAINKKKAITGSLIIREKNDYYNRLVFVYPDGDVEQYDKRHLFRFGREDEYFTQGRQRLILSYLGWRICPMISYDLRFPVWSANKNDYDILIYSSCWSEVRSEAWDILITARAIENESFVLATNIIGEGDLNFYKGRSKIVNFKGEIIEESLQVQEEILSATLDFDHLHKFRQKYDYFRDADKFGIFF